MTSACPNWISTIHQMSHIDWSYSPVTTVRYVAQNWHLHVTLELRYVPRSGTSDTFFPYFFFHFYKIKNVSHYTHRKKSFPIGHFKAIMSADQRPPIASRSRTLLKRWQYQRNFDRTRVCESPQISRSPWGLGGESGHFRGAESWARSSSSDNFCRIPKVRNNIIWLAVFSMVLVWDSVLWSIGWLRERLTDSSIDRLIEWLRWAILRVSSRCLPSLFVTGLTSSKRTSNGSRRINELYASSLLIATFGFCTLRHSDVSRGLLIFVFSYIIYAGLLLPTKSCGNAGRWTEALAAEEDGTSTTRQHPVAVVQRRQDRGRLTIPTLF